MVAVVGLRERRHLAGDAGRESGVEKEGREHEEGLMV